MTYRGDLERVNAALESYLTKCHERSAPVLIQPPMATLANELAIDELIKTGGLHGDRLDDFLEIYLRNATHIQHPANMGHQVSIPHPSGILGGLMDAFTNNPMAIYEMGAPAATIEYTLINWMLEKVGWRPSPYPGETLDRGVYGGGVLTHGGSLAQLTALAAARNHADPDIWENGNNPALVVIASDDAHYSVSRALGILGMGQKSLVHAPCDVHGRINPAQLNDLITQLEKSDKKIMAVVANAGCTAAGLYDRLNDIADVCEAHKVWLHVDGAHGASALLSEQHKHLLAGLERADSLIWDAHKMMRAPGLCASVLMKNRNHLDNAFQQQASYLFHDKNQNGFDAISRSVECTKAGIGLKFFMGLASEGEQGLADYLDGRYILATEAASLITDHPQLELAIEPQANIVCFRIKGTSDKDQLELRKKLLSTGESYITTTIFMSQRWLRFTFMNPASTMNDVTRTLALLLHINEELKC